MIVDIERDKQITLMLSNSPLAKQCTAKSKRSGERCRNLAVTGYEVCRMHGGKTPRGFALPQTKTARWSKDIPSRMAARFIEAQNDPDLLSVRADIYLLDTLLADDMTRLETGESAETWEMMRKAVDKLETGIAAQDYGRIHEGLQVMRDVVDKRILHYATVSEMRSKLEQRRKMVETESKITLSETQAITHEKAMLFVGAIGGILKARIHDPHILRAILADIDALLNVRETSG